MMAFTRSLFGFPILFFLARLKKVKLTLDYGERRPVLLVSLFGNFSTTVLYYSSYSFINVGMATALHYIFPVIVMLGSVVMFREKVRIWKVVSLILGLAGVVTFIPASGQNTIWGLVLALGSGFTYAGLYIAIEHTVMRRMHVYKIAFYSNLVIFIASSVLGTSLGALNFQLTSLAWFYSAVVSLMVSVIAFPLFNYAIVKCGATTTSIIAILEPLIGILAGYLVLKESLTPANIVGFVLILSGALMVSYFSSRSVELDG